jgi:two-component sensor histidine kinase
MEAACERPDGTLVPFIPYPTPLHDEAGKLVGAVNMLVDITERKRAEDQQSLLVRELHHRVKNTLATVQSLASQTARGAPTPAAFRERFEGRLIALSKAHNQLTVHHWESADLRGLLSGSLAPYAGVGPERVVLRGEDVELRPRAVLTLAMAFHELTTNAAKYGALSVAGGRIEIRWQPVCGESDSGPLLRIDWIEQGGPAVAEPQQRGFGSKLIEGSIAAELGGRARLAFEPTGLRCEIVIPLAAATIDADHVPAGVDWSV